MRPPVQVSNVKMWGKSEELSMSENGEADIFASHFCVVARNAILVQDMAVCVRYSTIIVLHRTVHTACTTI